MHPECWPHDLAEHVQTCAECSKLARDLRQLEDDWRRLPVPPEADQARAAFVLQLPALRATVKPPRRRYAPAVRWAMAAGILIAVGPFVYMIVSPGAVVASSNIVDDLIAWNLTLTSAEPGERQRLVAEREAELRDNLQKAKLTQEDREFAKNLLENAKWMAFNNDPLVEAGKWSDIADTLVTRIDLAAKQGDVQDAQRNASRYSKVRDQGVQSCMERANQKVWEPEQKLKGFGEIQRHDQWQRDQFEKMADHARPEMKKFFEMMQKKGRPTFPMHGPGPQFQGFKK
jgi:hypothetical protein